MPPFSLPALAPPTAMSVAQGIDQLTGAASIGGGKTDDAFYGMSMWFEVRVEGVGGNDKMGSWSGCSGLGVTFKSEAIKTSPSSVGETLTPQDIVYPDITLTRAMEPKSSAKVQKWLKRVAEHWVLDDASDTDRFAGTTVEIRLYSSLRPVKDAPKTLNGRPPHEVARWVLRNVYPKSWSGPTLNASGNEIATEKLVLAHEGFLELEKEQETYVVISDDTASLRLPYPPVNLQVVQNVSAKTANRASLDPAAAVSDPDKPNISFKTTIVGAKEVAFAQALLFAWLRKKNNGWERTKNKQGVEEWSPTKHQAAVNLVIGSDPVDAIKRTVLMRKCDFSITRLTTKGLPSRADISFSFEVLVAAPGTLLKSNPSTRNLRVVHEQPPPSPAAQPASLKATTVGDAAKSLATPLRKSDPPGDSKALP